MKDLSKLSIKYFQSNHEYSKPHMSQFPQNQITKLKLNRSKIFTLLTVTSEQLQSAGELHVFKFSLYFHQLVTINYSKTF